MLRIRSFRWDTVPPWWHAVAASLLRPCYRGQCDPGAEAHGPRAVSRSRSLAEDAALRLRFALRLPGGIAEIALWASASLGPQCVGVGAALAVIGKAGPDCGPESMVGHGATSVGFERLYAAGVGRASVVGTSRSRFGGSRDRSRQAAPPPVADIGHRTTVPVNVS